MKTNTLLMLLPMSFLLLMQSLNVYSSGPPNIPGFNRAVDRPKRSYFFNAQYGSSGFINSQIQNNKHWEIGNLSGLSFEVGYEKRLEPSGRNNPIISNDLRRFITLGFGLGYSEFGSLIESNNFSTTTVNKDIDGVETWQGDRELKTNVEWTVDYRAFQEDFSASFLHIPLYMEIGDVNPFQIGFFLRLGLNLAIPLDQKFRADGRYTVAVKESVLDNPDYYWFLDGIPELGYHTDAELFNGNDDYNLSVFQLSGVINAGISLPAPLHALYGLVFCISGQYSIGITNAVESSINDAAPGTFRSPAHDMKMVLDNDKPTRLQRFGFQIGLKYSPEFD